MVFWGFVVLRFDSLAKLLLDSGVESKEQKVEYKITIKRPLFPLML